MYTISNFKQSIWNRNMSIIIHKLFLTSNIKLSSVELQTGFFLVETIFLTTFFSNFYDDAQKFLQAT